MSRIARLAVATLFLAAASGCLPGGAGCDDLPDRVDITVTADGMAPSQPAVCRDRDVTLAVTPEVSGVLHVHGYDEDLPATTIVEGEPIELSFRSSRSGQFPVELHTEADPQGIDVGIFTVHEP